jgi:hypothetical protein
LHLIVALAAVASGVAWNLALFTGNNTTEAGVKGWLEALDMARVDETSEALKQWVNDRARQERWRQEHALNEPSLRLANGSTFDLARFESPQTMAVLSESESREAVRRLYDDRQHWIHMDKRAGPLPSFIYGTYYRKYTRAPDCHGH